LRLKLRMKYRCDICHSEMLGRPSAGGPQLCLLCRLSAEEASELIAGTPVPALGAQRPLSLDRRDSPLRDSSSASR